MTLQEAIEWCCTNDATVEFGKFINGTVILTVDTSYMLSGSDLIDAVEKAIQERKQIEEEVRLAQRERAYKKQEKDPRLLMENWGWYETPKGVELRYEPEAIEEVDDCDHTCNCLCPTCLG